MVKHVFILVFIYESESWVTIRKDESKIKIAGMRFLQRAQMIVLEEMVLGMKVFEYVVTGITRGNHLHKMVKNSIQENK